ncbi:MAG TPA: hypothetical protein VJB57_04060 [Dehalococcoidia bacterium]|nr:hypothetical protein [Dehalococcoidia bacterium]
MTTDPDRIHWPDLVAEGVAARQERDGAAWRLGDLALEVETSYGGGELQAYADAIGVAHSTLQDYRYVAGAFPLSDRSDNLTWTHHQRLAGRADRLDWLVRAVAGAWSVRTLREQLGLAAEAERTLEALIRSVSPSEKALKTIYANKGDIDGALCPEWAEQLGSSIEALGQLRDRLQEHAGSKGASTAGQHFGAVSRPAPR